MTYPKLETLRVVEQSNSHHDCRCPKNVVVTSASSAIQNCLGWSGRLLSGLSWRRLLCKFTAVSCCFQDNFHNLDIILFVNHHTDIYIYTYRWFTCGLHQKICRAFLYSSTLHMFAWPWQLPSYPTSVALGLSGSHLVRLDLHFTKWLKGCICDLQNVHR